MPEISVPQVVASSPMPGTNRIGRVAVASVHWAWAGRAAKKTHVRAANSRNRLEVAMPVLVPSFIVICPASRRRFRTPNARANHLRYVHYLRLRVANSFRLAADFLSRRAPRHGLSATRQVGRLPERVEW